MHFATECLISLKTMIISRISIASILILIAIELLQFMMYAFAPAVSPNSYDLHAAARDALIQINTWLVAELIILIFILFATNRLIIGKNNTHYFRVNIISICLVCIVSVTTMLWYSIDYYQKFI